MSFGRRVGVGVALAIVCSVGVIFYFFSLTPTPTPHAVENVPSGWTPEELTRYQSQLREHLARGMELLASSSPSVVELSEWKTYRSKECGFSFKYPAKYFVTDTATTTLYGIRCSAGLMEDTNYSHDYLAGKLDADGVPGMSISAESVSPASTTEGIVATVAQARPASDPALPPDPYNPITFVGEPAVITSWQTIDIADTISLYHRDKRYDLTSFGSHEDMRKDFYKIIQTLRLPLDFGHFYFKDAQHVYYQDRVLPGALVDSFEFLGEGYVAGMDTPTEGGYARDAKAVYYAGKNIDGADPASFVLTPRVGYAKDKNAQYAFGKKVKNDFVTCGSDLKNLSGGAALWSQKITALDAQHTPTADSFVEYCSLTDGSTLIGFVPHAAQSSQRLNETTGSALKHFYLFGADQRPVHATPTVLDCGKDSNPGWTLPRSIDVLDGTRAKLHCVWDGACLGRSIYILDIPSMRRGKGSITPTNEVYDCGYRG